MWFLLLQIFFLMVVAAACGAGLAWWWFRRNFEDVTVYHEELLARARDRDTPAPATKDDLANAIGALPVPDYAPLIERLSGIENALSLTGSAGLGAINDRFTSLNDRFGRVETLLQQPDGSLEAVLARLSDLESSILSVSNEVNRLQNADLDPVESRLAQLEDTIRSQTMPEPDFGPVHAGLARLELALESMGSDHSDTEPLRAHMAAMEARLAEFADRLDSARKSDLEELTIRLSTLSSSLAGLRMPDIDAVKERLSKIEAAMNAFEVPETDFTPMVSELRRIEGILKAPSDDLRTMHMKLADIEGGSASLHSKLSGVEHMVAMLTRSGVDLSPLQSRLSGVETALAALRVEMQSLPDLSPVISSMRKLDARLDMGAVDARLASIEYTLASLNHLMRARDYSYGRGEGEYSYRQSVHIPPRPEPPAYAPIDKVIPEPAGMRAPKSAPSERALPEDPIRIALRPGDKANLLVEAAFGAEDDLEIINGIGPMLCELLNEIGVYYFWQIADWGPAEVEWVDQKLEHFKGRIERDDWVGQAKELAKLPTSAKRPGAR